MQPAGKLPEVASAPPERDTLTWLIATFVYAVVFVLWFSNKCKLATVTVGTFWTNYIHSFFIAPFGVLISSYYL